MSRQVTKSQKDLDGDIIGISGTGWSRTKAEADGYAPNNLDSL